MCKTLQLSCNIYGNITLYMYIQYATDLAPLFILIASESVIQQAVTMVTPAHQNIAYVPFKLSILFA